MATRKANFIQSLVRVIRNSKSEKGYCPLIHYSLIQIITPEGGAVFRPSLPVPTFRLRSRMRLGFRVVDDLVIRFHHVLL